MSMIRDTVSPHLTRSLLSVDLPPPVVDWCGEQADRVNAQVLVVDGANVVGSRPDGWWRDRPGAAARLHGQLQQYLDEEPQGASRVILVLEGRARAGVPEGVTGSLEVVHAPGEGDDTIVDEVRLALTGGTVVVVTADRGLAARVQHLGATVVGPGWLLDRLASG
ncbi:hypothetical protein [Microlunatus phosphovorus]|uniref:hypothetical protein n=1 Tax=Microlunatus phosphovorus TaxID=29405 RepID=UPI0002E89506|nr:hypothetical protein [Microlunatus phosphovorus]